MKIERYEAMFASWIDGVLDIQGREPRRLAGWPGGKVSTSLLRGITSNTSPAFSSYECQIGQCGITSNTSPALSD